MAYVQKSGSASLNSVTKASTLYSVPASQNFRLLYFSLSCEAAIAASDSVTFEEDTTTPTLVNVIAALTPLVPGITSPCDYNAAGGNNLRLAIVTGTTAVTIHWSLVGELV